MASAWLRQRWSIRAKAFALAISYVVVLGAVYAVFTVLLVRRESKRAEDRLQQTASLVAAELDAYLEAGRQRLATVAHLPGMTYGLRTYQDAESEGRIPPWTSLHYLFFKSPVFTGGVFLLDRDGKVLWTEPPGLPWVGQNLGDETMIAAVYRGEKGGISGALPGAALFERAHVMMTYPVQHADGAIEGVLGGLIDLTAPEFTKILSAVSTSEGHFVAVFDAGEHLIAGSGPPTSDHRAPGGEKLMRVSVALTAAPWRVIAGQPRALALADVWRFRRLLLILGISVLAVAVAAGAPIVNGFVRTIRKVTAAAEVMARGDLSHPVQIGKRYDELATLAHTLEQMRVELERSRLALEHRLGEREDLIRLKEAFLANISHELRTPLNAILGYAEMLTDERLSPEGREFLETIRVQSNHLFDLLSDLLTLSNLNSGSIALEIYPVRIPAMMARLKPLADTLREGKDIELVWDFDESLPTIETDPLRLEQILRNLITNAFKFTSRGRIIVRAVAEPAPEQVAFEVGDTGIGIAPHELAHIFDEFRQLDDAVSGMRRGVGLGLTLVQGLAVLLRGSVTVTSEVGHGSVFRVRMPVRFESSAAPAAA